MRDFGISSAKMTVDPAISSTAKRLRCLAALNAILLGRGTMENHKRRRRPARPRFHMTNAYIN